ncbi:MAG: hypothetical protein WBM44_22480 [Waterburya sp.]
MPTKFLESLGNKLAERWLSTILTPAFIFWAGGIGAWIWRYGWFSIETWFNQQSQALQITLLISILLGVLISALVVGRCELVVLRLLEGYWPRWLRKLQRFCAKNQQKKKERVEQKFQQLMALREARNQPLTTEEMEESTRLDVLLHYYPIHVIMPTQLGNILRAAEERPKNQYGLDPFICWPRLWLLLPDSVKVELTEARIILNTGARIWLWSVLFFLWSPLAWWATFASILSAYLAYRWMLNAAMIYGDLLESAFDLYRIELYKSLRWPLPTSPQDERELGEQLTAYLWKRPGISPLTFIDSQ